jgi:hypothetical protein
MIAAFSNDAMLTVSSTTPARAAGQTKWKLWRQLADSGATSSCADGTRGSKPNSSALLNMVQWGITQTAIARYTALGLISNVIQGGQMPLEAGLLRCNVLWSCRRLPTSRRNVPPPSSALQNSQTVLKLLGKDADPDNAYLDRTVWISRPPSRTSSITTHLYHFCTPNSNSQVPAWRQKQLPRY